jgi:hypothetical protein
VTKHDRSLSKSLLIAAICSITVALAPLVLAGFDEQKSLETDRLLIRNLIGRVEIVGHDSTEFEIDVQVRGRDATPERVRVAWSEGHDAELRIEFPLGESRRYVYPALGNGQTSFSPSDGSWISRMLGSSRKVEVTGHGRGLEIWVDISVRVPRGKTLTVEHGVGKIDASDLSASLTLACRSCPIEVADVRGDVIADTGSGSVSIRDVQGNVTADTGSGRVEISSCKGERLHIDTGSGRVDIESVDIARLYVDTGSGRVNARSVGADEVEIDTGSGSVELQLDRMGSGNFEIDTGSGGVKLDLPPDASAMISADTGSGGIRLDLAEGYELLHKDSDEARLRIGEGDARVTLDTGSGSIRISQ